MREVESCWQHCSCWIDARSKRLWDVGRVAERFTRNRVCICENAVDVLGCRSRIESSGMFTQMTYTANAEFASQPQVRASMLVRPHTLYVSIIRCHGPTNCDSVGYSICEHNSSFVEFNMHIFRQTKNSEFRIMLRCYSCESYDTGLITNTQYCTWWRTASVHGMRILQHCCKDMSAHTDKLHTVNILDDQVWIRSSIKDKQTRCVCVCVFWPTCTMTHVHTDMNRMLRASDIAVHSIGTGCWAHTVGCRSTIWCWMWCWAEPSHTPDVRRVFALTNRVFG